MCVRLFSCIISACMLCYCNTVRWAWLDWGLSGWVTTLRHCFDTVGWVIRPVKISSCRFTYWNGDQCRPMDRRGPGRTLLTYYYLTEILDSFCYAADNSVLVSKFVCSGRDAAVLSKLLVDRSTILAVTSRSDPSQTRYRSWAAAVTSEPAVIQAVPGYQQHNSKIKHLRPYVSAKKIRQVQWIAVVSNPGRMT